MEDDNDDTRTTTSSNSISTGSLVVTLPDIGGHSSVMKRELGSADKKEKIKGAAALFSGLLSGAKYQPINWKGAFTTGIEKVRQPGQSKADFEHKRIQRAMEQAEYDRVASQAGSSSGAEERAVTCEMWAWPPGEVNDRKILIDLKFTMDNLPGMHGREEGVLTLDRGKDKGMRRVVDQLQSHRLLEFVERLAGDHELDREFLLRKDELSSLWAYPDIDNFMVVEKGSELHRLVSELYEKYGRCKYFQDVTARPDGSDEKDAPPLGLAVNRGIIKAVVETRSPPKRGTSLLDRLAIKHESIMDGALSWKKLGVDLEQVPDFLKLEQIYKTEHTFKADFEVEPATFVFRGKEFSFLEPFHCLTLYKNETCSMPMPYADGQVVKGRENCVEVYRYEKSPQVFEFESKAAFDAHIAAFQLLRKLCVEHMHAVYLSKHGTPITASELNRKLLREARVKIRREILHNMVVFVVHHLGVYKDNTQDPRFPELFPIVMKILDRWDKDADSLKAEIARKGDVVNDLLEVIQYLSLNHERRYGRTEIQPTRMPSKPLLGDDPAFLVDYLSNLSIDSDEDEGDEANLFRPECETDEDEPANEDKAEAKKSVKRPATPEPLRPEGECKKPASS